MIKDQKKLEKKFQKILKPPDDSKTFFWILKKRKN